MTKLTGERLRNLRMILGLTQMELADKLGYNDQSIARYEQGRSPVPPEMTGLLKPLLIEHMNLAQSAMQDLQQ